MKELTDICDYVVINLAANGAKSNGLAQYYKNSAALQKLLKGCSLARAQELGRLAASEYEMVTGDNEDYLTSVQRQYQRKGLISGLKPLSLFIKVDMQQASDPGLKIREFASACLSNNIDGLIIANSNTPEDQIELIKQIRKFDVNNKLIVVAEGCLN